MYKLSERQQLASLRKMKLEKDIMAKSGVDDEDLWTELRETRVEINSMAQEKLLLVAKLYNLAQKFVKELDVATEETSKQMEKSTAARHGPPASGDLLAAMGKMHYK